MNDESKALKNVVGYKHGYADRRCGICVMFLAPDKCVSVRGDINPWSLCKLFERKKD